MADRCPVQGQELSPHQGDVVGRGELGGESVARMREYLARVFSSTPWAAMRAISLSMVASTIGHVLGLLHPGQHEKKVGIHVFPVAALQGFHFLFVEHELLVQARSLGEKQLAQNLERGPSTDLVEKAGV